jgi:hypothetical protein
VENKEKLHGNGKSDSQYEFVEEEIEEEMEEEQVEEIGQ